MYTCILIQLCKYVSDSTVGQSSPCKQHAAKIKRCVCTLFRFLKYNLLHYWYRIFFSQLVSHILYMLMICCCAYWFHNFSNWLLELDVYIITAQSPICLTLHASLSELSDREVLWHTKQLDGVIEYVTVQLVGKL